MEALSVPNRAKLPEKQTLLIKTPRQTFAQPISKPKKRVPTPYQMHFMRTCPKIFKTPVILHALPYSSLMHDSA